jgi:glycosyltransferase involved in cell wall biosynthesis
MSAAPRVAICLATHNPRPGHLEQQLHSILEQSVQDWVCIVSDDCSREDPAALIEELTGSDPRFRLSRSERRLGFYRNFERALRLVPGGAEFVALADQDDIWDEDKLAAMVGALGAAPSSLLAYSDFRVADPDGQLISDTFWFQRRNRFDSMASLLVANTVTGAASIFRRRLLDLALPFPEIAGQPYHDHWLALVALANGPITYLDRPTYTHRRHAESVTVQAQRGVIRRPERRRPLLTRARARLADIRHDLGTTDWQRTYQEGYVPVAELAAELERRFGDAMPAEAARDVRRLRRAERSPLAALWLLARGNRHLFGADETMARERLLFGAIVARRWGRLRGR